MWILGEFGLVGLAASQYHSNMGEWFVCVYVGGFMCVPLFLFVCWKLLGYSSKKPSVYKEMVYKEHLEY